jgi:SET domain
MDAIYKDSKKTYKSLVDLIKKQNTVLVDNLKTRHIPKSDLFCSRDKSVIPFIFPDPKTNFLSITRSNIFTKDDPILRYVPSIKTTQPASINWYEGTVIGDKPYDASNTTNLLFIRFCLMNHKVEEAIAFLRLIQQKTSIEYQSGKPSFSKMFCSCCLLFDCGIHNIVDGIVLKYSEKADCVCSEEQFSKASFLPAENSIGSGIGSNMKDYQNAIDKYNSERLRYISPSNLQRHADSGTMSLCSFLHKSTSENNIKTNSMSQDNIDNASDKVSETNASKDEYQKNTPNDKDLDLSIEENNILNSIVDQKILKSSTNEKSAAGNEFSVSKIIEDLRQKYLFKSCVIRKILQIKNNLNVNCEQIQGPEKAPVKSVRLSIRKTSPKEFFIPCKHEGPCNKNTCSCVRAGVACELSCLCVKCDNVKFCSCSECTELCPCTAELRECSELCVDKQHNAQKNRVKGSSRDSYRKMNKKSQCLSRNEIFYNEHKSCRGILAQEKNVSICASMKHGYGLFSEENISAGQFVIEYVGEIITDKEAERRGNFYEMNKCSYLFNLINCRENCLYSVDAALLGNKSRYINHSAKHANLKAEVLVIQGNTKIVFYALRNIYKGEEFLFDYQFSEEHKLKHGIVD